MHSRRMEYKSIEENIKKKFFNFLKWKKSQEIAKLLFYFFSDGLVIKSKVIPPATTKKRKKKKIRE